MCHVAANRINKLIKSFHQRDRKYTFTEKLGKHEKQS
jgi:hypothetical protein